jgi:hypothetical protein
MRLRVLVSGALLSGETLQVAVHALEIVEAHPACGWSKERIAQDIVDMASAAGVPAELVPPQAARANTGSVDIVESEQE